jgi:hypothetical protein
MHLFTATATRTIVESVLKQARPNRLCRPSPALGGRSLPCLAGRNRRLAKDFEGTLE